MEDCAGLTRDRLSLSLLKKEAEQEVEQELGFDPGNWNSRALTQMAT
jgi:hypothetical protein